MKTFIIFATYKPNRLLNITWAFTVGTHIYTNKTENNFYGENLIYFCSLEILKTDFCPCLAKANSGLMTNQRIHCQQATAFFESDFLKINSIKLLDRQ